MTDEERRIITEFVERVARAEGEAVDPDADRLLADLETKHPAARYRLAQLAFFQEHALTEAQNRIKALEWQLEQSKAQKGGMLGGLFGSNRPTGAPPAPQHAPNYRPGLFDPNQPGAAQPASPWMRGRQTGGGGFLAGAAQTAVGVMGGMVLGSMVASMMGFGGAEAAEPAAEAEPDAMTDEPAAADGGFDTDGFDSDI